MASNGSIPVPSYPGYPSEAEYNALKRTYLSLLPPAQIIDICLVFEAYVPLHVRSTIWPYDLKSSIATLVAKNSASNTPTVEDVQTRQKSSSSDQTNHEPPPMDSLKVPSSDLNNVAQSSDSKTQSASPEQPATSTLSQIPAQPQQSPYYSYQSQAQQPAYPHAPYYQSQQAGYYQQQPPSFPLFPSPYNTLSAQQPNFTPPPFTRPPLTRLDGTPAEDLPSYEEMIVEALTEYTDPEGAAPKDLFAWMAARYPLQTNFRPSASQALQKAFKRGRLEKQSNGKYRLNIKWEGGTTSRRSTRRPQTQAVMMMQHNQQAAPYGPASGGPTETSPPPMQKPFAYGFPGYPHQQQPQENTPLLPSSEHEDVGEGSDAWEAAQNILKAINFGNILQQVASDPSEQPQNQKPSSQASSQAPSQTEPSLKDDENGGEALRKDRAGLQAELALLAAQLAELGDTEPEEADSICTPDKVPTDTVRP